MAIFPKNAVEARRRDLPAGAAAENKKAREETQDKSASRRDAETQREKKERK
jgi:hypothetical protein